MSNVKDKLKSKAKPKLATSKISDKNEIVKSPVVVNELDLITKDIKSSLEEMQDIADFFQKKKIRVNELKQFIIEKLLYVRDNKKTLLQGITFEHYLVNEIGISKGYFYEQIQAYNLCVEYKKPELFQEVDHKVLVKIAREKDLNIQKELINRAPYLTRDDFAKKKVSPTDFSLKPKNELPGNIYDIVVSPQSKKVDKKDLLSFVNAICEREMGLIDTYNSKDDIVDLDNFYSGKISLLQDILYGLREINLIDDQDSVDLYKKVMECKVK